MQFLRLSLCCKWVEQSTQTKENTQIFGRKHLAHPIYATVGNLARNRTSQTCSSRMEYMVAQSHQCHISTYLARSRPAGASEGRMLQIWSDCYARMGHISKYQFHGFNLTKRICHATVFRVLLLKEFCYSCFVTITSKLVIYFKEDNWFLDWTVGQIFLWKRKGRWSCVSLPLTAFSRILLERFCREENIKDLCQSPMSSWFDLHKLLQS